jgi:hypothetical protein
MQNTHEGKKAGLKNPESFAGFPDFPFAALMQARLVFHGFTVYIVKANEKTINDAVHYVWLSAASAG